MKNVSRGSMALTINKNLIGAYGALMPQGADKMELDKVRRALTATRSMIEVQRGAEAYAKLVKELSALITAEEVRTMCLTARLGISVKDFFAIKEGVRSSKYLGAIAQLEGCVGDFSDTIKEAVVVYDSVHDFSDRLEFIVPTDASKQRVKAARQFRLASILQDASFAEVMVECASRVKDGQAHLISSGQSNDKDGHVVRHFTAVERAFNVSKSDIPDTQLEDALDDLLAMEAELTGETKPTDKS